MSATWPDFAPVEPQEHRDLLDAVKPYVDDAIEDADAGATLTEIVTFTTTGPFEKGDHPDAKYFVVTLVGAGGGGGANRTSSGANGSASTFGALLTAPGGLGGRHGSNAWDGRAAPDGEVSQNGGEGGYNDGNNLRGADGMGGQIRRAVFTPAQLSSSETVTIGGGGAAGTDTQQDGGDGGDGRCDVEVWA